MSVASPMDRRKAPSFPEGDAQLQKPEEAEDPAGLALRILPLSTSPGRMSLNPRIPFITKENSLISQDVLTIAKKGWNVKGAIDCGFRNADCGLKQGNQKKRIKK